MIESSRRGFLYGTIELLASHLASGRSRAPVKVASFPLRPEARIPAFFHKEKEKRRSCAIAPSRSKTTTQRFSNALGEGFNVIGWVMLWRPVEAYFFNPIPIRTSSTVHRFLKTLRIEIRPQPQETA